MGVVSYRRGASRPADSRARVRNASSPLWRYAIQSVPGQKPPTQSPLWEYTHFSNFVPTGKALTPGATAAIFPTA